jgi:hypothetical protein
MTPVARGVSFLLLAALTAVSIEFGPALSGTAIIRGQVDDFESDTTMGWQIGVPDDPFSPVVIEDGGIGGAGDAYLLARSSGLGGPGSKLVIYNDAQWTGNYKDAGVNIISMHLNNLDTVDLQLRLRLESDSGGSFVSKDSVFLPAMSGWVVKQFPVVDSTLFGGANVDKALRTVNRLRLYHGTTRAWSPREVKAQLGIDNIAAIGGGVGQEGYPGRGRALRASIKSVYPNPATDNIVVELEGTGRGDDNVVQICDILGRRVAAFSSVSSTLNVQISDLPSGLYWIVVVDGTNGATITDTQSFLVTR